MGRASCVAKNGDAVVRDSRGWMLICVPASKITRTWLGVMSGKDLCIAVSANAYWVGGELTLSVRPSEWCPQRFYAAVELSVACMFAAVGFEHLAASGLGSSVGSVNVSSDPCAEAGFDL
jgi:hypothetical protein